VAEGFELAKAFVTVDMQAKKVQGQLNQLERGVDSSASRMERRFVGIGKKLVAVFAGISGIRFLKGVIDETARWSEQIAKVSTMLDTRAMPIMEDYKDAIEDLGFQYGQSSKVLSKGLYDILSSAFAAEDAVQILNVATMGAKAGFTATSTSVDIMTTILNSYKLEAEDALYVSDLLFAAVKRGKTTYEELAQSIGNVTAVSNLAGLELEELLALYSTLTRGGIKPPEAVTAIQGMLRAFLKPQKEAIQLAKEWGFELNSNTLRSEGLLSVMEKLQFASAEELATIGGRIRGFKAIAVAIGDLEGLEKDIRLEREAGGSTVEAADKAMSTFKHTIDQLTVSWNTFKHSFGEELVAPVAKPSAKGASWLLDYLSGAAKGTSFILGSSPILGGSVEGTEKESIMLGLTDTLAGFLGSAQSGYPEERTRDKAFWRRYFGLDAMEGQLITEGASALEKPKALEKGAKSEGGFFKSERGMKLLRRARVFGEMKWLEEFSETMAAGNQALTGFGTEGRQSELKQIQLLAAGDKRGAEKERIAQTLRDEKVAIREEYAQRVQSATDLSTTIGTIVTKSVRGQLKEEKRLSLQMVEEISEFKEKMMNKRMDKEDRRNARKNRKQAHDPFGVLNRIWGEGGGIEKVSIPPSKLRDQTITKLQELIIVSEKIEKNTGMEARISR
jgi:TP901 family phage tail tape measure protein